MMQNKFIKSIVFFAIFLLLFSCKEKQPEREIKIITTTPASFDMHKTSEMALLMDSMLEKNKEVKNAILNGEKLAAFPDKYLKIHTAILTDPSDRNASFETFSNLYIKNMQDVFTADKKHQKKEFNEAIQSCVACHKTTCPGPIPRIKKLLIN